MKRSISIAAAVGLLCVAAARADAGLIGATVSSTYYFPNLGSLVDDDGTQKVAPTATFLVFGGVAIETITDTQIVVFDSTGFAFGTFNGPIFDFLGSGNLITGLTINSSSNMTGFTASNITLLSDGAGGQLVELNFQGLKTGSNVTLDVATTPATRPPAPAPTLTSTVPEPTSVTLFGIMFACSALYIWRHRRKSALQFESPRT